MKQAQPSVSETAFSCPHCSAYTTQRWHSAYCLQNDERQRTPVVPDESTRKHFESLRDIDGDARAKLLKWCDQMIQGFPFLEMQEQAQYLRAQLQNLFISECYNCRKLAVWVNRSLVFPPVRTGPVPNIDLPEDVARDFDEARSIVSVSPRGAAALLRLAIQKLCSHLGEKGKNIDADIASLVSKGLSPIVQQSLDIVRVIGNEAVHPGTIDLRDDPEAAASLFDLVNAIAQQMISHPKTVSALYAKLPEEKRRAIEARDAKQR